jgi:transposase
MTLSETFCANVDQQLTRWLGAIPVLMPILKRLNLVSIINRYVKTEADVDSGTVALILALNRLLAPKPLYKVGDWMATTVLEETLAVPAEKLHDRRIGDLLDLIHPHIDAIWKEIVRGAITEFGIPIDFIHYDITSIYFEGEYQHADKIEYGYSRDKRPDCKQVNLRLNVTGDNAIPLAYQVISGSTADKTTPLQNMRALPELFDKPIPEPTTATPPTTAATQFTTADDSMIIVSDPAMLCPQVIVTYHEKGIGYLGPLANHKAYDSVLMSVGTDELINYPLNYHPVNHDKNEPPVYYGLPTEVTISVEKTGQSVTANALLLYSRNKAKLDFEKRQTLLDRYLNRLSEIQSHLNRRKYKKASYATDQIQKAARKHQAVKSLVIVELTGADGNLSLKIEISLSLFAEAKERDGRYLLVTNTTLSPEQILTRFKQQDSVEKRFSTIKGPICIRPMFLHNDKRIESLVFICMIALLVFSLLEMMAKRAGEPMTAKRIIEQFTTLWGVYTDFVDGSQTAKVVRLTEFQRNFIKTLELPEPDIYLTPQILQ